MAKNLLQFAIAFRRSLEFSEFLFDMFDELRIAPQVPGPLPSSNPVPELVDRRLFGSALLARYETLVTQRD